MCKKYFTVRLRAISTVNQLADILTKNTGIGIFSKMRDAIFQETLWLLLPSGLHYANQNEQADFRGIELSNRSSFISCYPLIIP